MGSAELTYVAKAPGGLPPTMFPVELPASERGLSSLKIDYRSEQHEVVITLVLDSEDAPEVDEALGCFDDLALGLVDHLAFELGFPVDMPVPLSYSVAGGGVTVFAQAVGATIGCGAVAVGTPDSLRAKLASFIPPNELLQEFNSAVRLQNSVHKFLALWGLLGYLAASGNVRAIDRYLNELGVPYEPDPGPHGSETRFARMRGELSHPTQRGVRLSEISQRLESVLPQLESLVRQQVATQLSLP